MYPPNKATAGIVHQRLHLQFALFRGKGGVAQSFSSEELQNVLSIAAGAPLSMPKTAIFAVRDPREQLLTIHGVQLSTVVHTLFRYPTINPNLKPTLVHLLSVSRVPNGIRSGRDQR